MSSGFAALIALLSIFAAGLGPSVLLLRNTARVEIVKLVGLSWFVGTIVVSIAIWLLAMVMRNSPLHVAVTMICLAFGTVGCVLLLREGGGRLQIWRLRNWREWLLAVVICLEIATVVVLTFRNTLGWDGLVIWELKARYAFLNGGALPAGYFSDPTRAYSHPEYPLYLPMLETWMYFWIGDCDQYWVKLIFPVFYAAGVLLLADAASFWSDRRWIGLLTASLFFFVPLLTRAEGGIINGYVDVPLSFVYLGAFYFLSIFAEENSSTALPIFVLLGAALPWIKRDGMILWLILASCGAWIIWRRRGLANAILSLLPGMIVIAGWQIYLRQMHVYASREFLSVTPSVLRSNLYRVGPVMHALLKELTALSHWSLLWLVGIIAFVCMAWRNRSERAVVLFICTVLPVGVYCSAYLFSAWPDYSQHVNYSLRRLLLHVAPLCLLAVAAALTPRQTVPRNSRLT
jgi:hypothetical protein